MCIRDRAYFDCYNSLHGVRTYFYQFFHNCLKASEQAALLEGCWVLKSNPLPFTYDLQWIDTERCYDNMDLDAAADGRRSWNVQDKQTQLTWIAEALYAVRNLYTHSLVPYSSTQDKEAPKIEGLNNGEVLNRGDTIFLWEKNMAISFAHRPATEYVRDIVMNGLKNHYHENYEEG